MFGAFTFMTLENGGSGRDGNGVQQIRNGQHNQHQHQQPGQPQQQQHQPQYQLTRNDKLRAQTVEKLWKITEDLNILYRDNWTRLAEQEILKFQDSLIRKYGGPNQSDHRHRWNFASSFLYSLTLITTIGKFTSLNDSIVDNVANTSIEIHESLQTLKYELFITISPCVTFNEFESLLGVTVVYFFISSAKSLSLQEGCYVTLCVSSLAYYN